MSVHICAVHAVNCTRYTNMSASSGERYKATRGQRGRGWWAGGRGGAAAGRRDGAFSPNGDDPDQDRRPENSRGTSRGYGRYGRGRGSRAGGYGRAADSGQQASRSVEREARARTPEGGRGNHGERYRGRSSYGSRGRGRGAGALRAYAYDRGRGNSPPPNAGRMYTSANIKSLSTLPSAELANKVDSQLKEFQQAIGKPEILGKSGDVMDAVVTILLKLTELARGSGGACAVSPDAQRAAIRIVAEILSERTDKFHFQLQRAVKNSTAIQARRVCNLFLAMLTTFESSAWSCLPIDDLYESAERLTKGNLDSELLKLAQELREIRDRIRNAHTSDKFNNADEKKASDDERDDSEFRSLPILPEWKEINNNNGIPLEVRPNKVEGRYKDWTQYYDIQFRLIREDFIAPLRRGITAYLHGEKGKKNRDVKTYSNASISSQVTTKDKGICFNVQFDVSGFRRVNYNWDHSKRLTFGSLLCFIPVLKSRGDSLFATVADRDSKELTKGVFMVQFVDALAAISHCREETKFEIVESNSYFEATRPILRSIQKAEDKTMPFTKELIEGECDSVSPPVYLRNTRKNTYNLSCLHGSVKRKLKPPLIIEVLNKESWSAASNSELDSSQLNAIQTALTREIAVIQGPPGTGKTYIGLKIVEALLENRDVWDPSKTSPILVMCFTNHALDQFLEGIIDSQCCERRPQLIRVGSRSKSEKVDEYNLNKVRRNAPRHRDYEISREIGRVRKTLENCNPEKVWKEVDTYHGNAVRSANLLPVSIIRHVADPDHFYQLIQVATCIAHKDKEVEVWLGLWEQDWNKKEKSDKVVSPERKEHNNMPKIDAQKTKAQQMHTQDNQGERNDTTKVQHTQDKQDEGMEGMEELITIEGEATLVQEERMLCGDAEGFERAVVKEDNEQYTVSHEPLNEEHSSSSDDDSDEEVASQRHYRNDYSDFKTKKKKKPKKPTWCRKENADRVIRANLFKNLMEDEEANEIEDICQLNNGDRWRLYNYWAEKRHDHLRECNRAEVQKYNELCTELADLRQLEDRYILEKADVVGMTTTGAARYQHILHHIKPKVVIVEEAAEVLEAHIVSALSAGTQHLILIGDHKQLRPKPNEHVLATKYKLAVSLFERLVKKNLSQATLEIQHRMRPDIARLVCPHVYDRLLNHESVEKYPDVKGISKNLFLVRHTQPESENPNLLSYVNEFEAKYIVGLCAHLLNLGYSPSQITVLTPYVGQLLKLRDKMPRNQFEGVRVTAIDNFQGEENDIILFSMVRSTSGHSQRATIGFLKEDNRVCVSLSRAKHGFYAIGNFQLIRQQSILWESIISDVEERGCFGDAMPLYCCNHPDTTYEAKNASDFKTNAPNGGCQKDCDIRLQCGHVCTQKCHVKDIEHKHFLCKKQCVRRDSYDHQCKPKHICCKKCPPCYEIVQKVMPGCGHEQEMKCCENLPCQEIVTKVIPGCGHEQGVPCSVDPNKCLCQAPCPKSCENGHPCPKRCSQHCSRCIVEVEKEIPVCKHIQMVPCHLHPDLFKCRAPCLKYCENGLHQCLKVCSENCGKCKVDVQKKFPECGHTKNLPCWVEPNPTMCQAECQKLCPNEQHTLRKLCNQDWLPCKKKVTKTVPKCGHSITVPCFQDPAKILCTNPCEKSCKEGHRCQKLCHEDCGPCSVMVQKEMFCGHTYSMECSTNRFTFKCPMQCLKPVCKNGHKCKKQCHYPRLCKSCDETVQKIMPLCGHEERIPCHMSADPQKHGYVCKHPCEKKLECGHLCLRKCGESCQIMCTKKVTIKLLCGHTDEIECYKKSQNKTSMINCKEKVNVKIICGHTAKTECWKAKYKTLLKDECSLPCKKVLECGHVCQEVCKKPCTTQCKKVVEKRWPCGHRLKRKCFQTKNMEKYPCNDKCLRKLSCGHWCTNSCSEPCSTCRKKSSRKYPCGHSTKIPCNSTTEDYPCKKECTVELSCGHRCSGRCGDCYSSRMHAICIYDVKVFHYYGRSETVPCAGLSCLCRQEQQLPCCPSHGGDYTQCREPCRWDCPHFHCTNECREECDRPPCNQPCKKRLPCGHQCPGVCGEPCLSVCPECNSVEFEKKLYREKRKQGKSPTGQMYIELGCRHVFNVEFLDTYMDPKVKTIMPKQCPKCHQNIAPAFRYGNAAKRGLRDVMNVDDIVKQYNSIPKIEKDELAIGIRELETTTVHVVPVASKCIRSFARKLSSATPVTQEESFLAHCLISYIRLYNIVRSHAITRSDLEDIMMHLNFSVNRLIKSAHDFHSISGYDRASHYMASDIMPKRNRPALHLSWQLLNDFKSELYHIALCAQCIIVKDQQTIAGSALSTTKSADARAPIDTYLYSLNPLIHRISEEDYEKYSGLIKEAFPSATAIHVQTPSLPPVIKGTWTKCPNGHYYCKPPMRGSGTKPLGKCPECQ